MASLNTSVSIRDQIVLETLEGMVELLGKQIRAATQGKVTFAAKTSNSITLVYEGPIQALKQLRSYSTGSIVLAPLQAQAAPSLATITQNIDASLDHGLLSALQTNQEPLHFRISPLRYGRWQIKDFLIDHYGWVNDPSAWDINLEVFGKHLVGQIGPLYYTQRFSALQHIPASTNPLVANAMVNLLDVFPGQTVYDPFCGAATLLVEVLQTVPDTQVVGNDISTNALKIARQNLSVFKGRWKLSRADATKLQQPEQSIERLLCNLPFGKRVGSHQKNQELYPLFATELARVLAPKGRTVLLTEEKELLRASIRATRKLHIVHEQLLQTGGLHPSLFVVTH